MNEIQYYQAADEITADVHNTEFVQWCDGQRQHLEWIVTQFQHFQITQSATSLIQIRSAQLHSMCCSKKANKTQLNAQIRNEKPVTYS